MILTSVSTFFKSAVPNKDPNQPLGTEVTEVLTQMIYEQDSSIETGKVDSVKTEHNVKYIAHSICPLYSVAILLLFKDHFLLIPTLKVIFSTHNSS